jgi:hypothetical protein
MKPKHPICVLAPRKDRRFWQLLPTIIAPASASPGGKILGNETLNALLAHLRDCLVTQEDIRRTGKDTKTGRVETSARFAPKGSLLRAYRIVTEADQKAIITTLDDITKATANAAAESKYL